MIEVYLTTEHLGAYSFFYALAWSLCKGGGAYVIFYLTNNSHVGNTGFSVLRPLFIRQVTMKNHEKREIYRTKICRNEFKRDAIVRRSNWSDFIKKTKVTPKNVMSPWLTSALRLKTCQTCARFDTLSRFFGKQTGVSVLHQFGFQTSVCHSA